MADPEIAHKAPYVLELEPGTYFWCACGKSGNQPFCDSSHQGTEFTPKKIEVSERTGIALCGCKRTADAPFCDGSHSDL
jgi:CDGSH-type Zn-finger protein